MNLPKIFPIAFLLLALGVGINAQERPSAVLVDEVGETCSELLMAILDNFTVELGNHPSSHGVITVHGNRSRAGQTQGLITWIVEYYLVVRGFDKSRITIVRGGDQEEQKIQLWRLPPGAEYPETADFQPRDWLKTTQMFDRAWTDLQRKNGRTEIYSDGFYNLGCGFRPDTNTFAMILGAFPSLTGYIIVYTAPTTGKATARRVARFAVNDLVRRHRVPRSRLKVLIGGQREVPEIEFWFVPKDGSPPIAEPAADVTSR